MKKQLFLMADEHGFFLPYVLFIAALVFIVLTASINIYKNDLEITHRLEEQLKVKTLLQMGKQRFKTNMDNITESADNVDYTFPDGSVSISYYPENEGELRLSFRIKTKTDATYQFNNIVMMTGVEKTSEDNVEGKKD